MNLSLLEIEDVSVVYSRKVKALDGISLVRREQGS